MIDGQYVNTDSSDQRAHQTLLTAGHCSSIELWAGMNHHAHAQYRCTHALIKALHCFVTVSRVNANLESRTISVTQ